MKKLLAIHGVALLLILGFVSCDKTTQTGKVEGLDEIRNQNPENQEFTLQPAPQFNGDSAYFFIQKQVEFGPRVPNTSAHKACGNYLVQVLKDMGATVIEQDFIATAFSGTKLESKNIIAQFNPSQKERILLGAHWDSRPFADQDTDNQDHPIDGANDGASGVGVLLEIMRILQSDSTAPVGVDIILFDSEDYGQPEGMDYQPDTWCLGAQHWAKNLHQPNYSPKYGILLDMVGAKDAKFYKEGISLEYAPNVVKKVWKTGSKLGYENFFVEQSAGAITDDHFYVNRLARIPMIDIIQHDPNSTSYFGSYWHTHNDNMEVIDKATLKAVGQTVLQVIYNEKPDKAS